jgi:hypothetical protein
MTKRAFLWCGYVKPPTFERKRRIQSDYDFPASVRDIDFAVQAAQALGVARDETYAFVCRDDLLPVDFEAARAYPATHAAVEQVVKAIAPHADGGDALLFVATNHGLSDGLLTSAEVDEFSETDAPRLLTPEALDSSLQRLAGEHVIVIAACHAGAFLSLGDRPNRLVLAACAEHEKYYVADEEAPRSPFLVKLLGSWCGIALPGEVPPPRLSLAEAFALVEEDLTSSTGIRPLRRGMASWS